MIPVPARLTVLVVDDHAGFRSAVRTLLEAGGFEVVGSVATGAEGVTAAAALRPDVVLLDVRLPDATGHEVAARLRAAGSDAHVVLVSSLPGAVVRAGMDAADVVGFLPKDDLTPAALDRLLAAP